MFDLERSIVTREGVIQADKMSPVKSWPDPNKILSGNEVPFSLRNIPIVGRHLASCIRQGCKAIESIKDNPANPRTRLNQNELDEFKTYAIRHGVSDVGFTEVPPVLIFQERAILYEKAIVLIMEMDKTSISKAPSVDTFRTVMSTYDELGIAANKLTALLRKMGFGAQAGHPLGGLTVYPPLAVSAGLGWFGRHGLLITPRFGPRQRIAAIFTNIRNLPLPDSNPHGWIGDFCKKCGRCISTCPAGAILQNPLRHASGRVTHIIRERCLHNFVKQNGCTVCVKECAFKSKTLQSTIP